VAAEELRPVHANSAAAASTIAVLIEVQPLIRSAAICD
jgi:hypothetical protein